MAGDFPKYGYPTDVVAGLALSAVFGRRRSFRADAIRCHWAVGTVTPHFWQREYSPKRAVRDHGQPLSPSRVWGGVAGVGDQRRRAGRDALGDDRRVDRAGEVVRAGSKGAYSRIAFETPVTRVRVTPACRPCRRAQKTWGRAPGRSARCWNMQKAIRISSLGWLPKAGTRPAGCCRRRLRGRGALLCCWQAWGLRSCR